MHESSIGTMKNSVWRSAVLWDQGLRLLSHRGRSACRCWWGNKAWQGSRTVIDKERLANCSPASCISMLQHITRRLSPLL